MIIKKRYLFKSALFLLIFLVPVFVYKSINLINKRNNIAEQAILDRAVKPQFGDLTKIKKRRSLRVLVSYSKTNFFFDGPRIRGFDYEVMRQLEKHINRNIENEFDKIKFRYIVYPFEELLDRLVSGHGDIAAANFTVTDQRKEKVQFSDPYINDVNEVIIHHKSVTDINSIDDLSSKNIFLLSGSSYIEHLKQTNEKLASRDLPESVLMPVEPHLTSEDIFELVNANVYPITIADDFSAKLWKDLLPNIVVRDDIKVNSGGQIAWAIRQDSPELLSLLNNFNKKIAKGSRLGNIFFRSYFVKNKWIKNPTITDEVVKLKQSKKLLKKYANKYNFDWLSIAALAYQESNLDHSKVSPKGAVGIMQIMPRTAAGNPVYIKDIHQLENNIRAGVKYLSYLKHRYYSSPEIAPEDQIDFSWAAYNAGPKRINDLRKLAKSYGYDPNKWFANVERIAAKAIGDEPVRYVSNINKYYIAYKLSEERL